MNLRDPLRDIESDFGSVCGIVELTRRYPHLANPIIKKKKKITLGNEKIVNTANLTVF